MNFISIQMSHYIPTADKSMARVRTGYERIIAQRSRLPFAYSALEDGKVLDINEELKTVAIQYKTKGMYVLSYAPDYTKNGGGGFFITQNVGINNLHKGKAFKKNDILLYNTDFFTNDPYTSQVDLSLGVIGNVAFMEGANIIEDGSVMSRDLSKRLGCLPVRMRFVLIHKNTVIHSVATLQSKVRSIDPLIVFDESDLGVLDIKDKASIDAIASLNKSTPKAKYSGTVVKIEAFHKCPVEEMSDSVKTFIRSITKMDKAKSKYAANANNKNMFTEHMPINGDKVDGTILDDDTIILKFYIQQSLNMESGDKLVFDGALKSVNSTIMEKDILVEDGTKVVDAIMCASSINNRMVMSPIFMGTLETILEEVEHRAIDMYFK